MTIDAQVEEVGQDEFEMFFEQAIGEKPASEEAEVKPAAEEAAQEAEGAEAGAEEAAKAEEAKAEEAKAEEVKAEEAKAEEAKKAEAAKKAEESKAAKEAEAARKAEEAKAAKEAEEARRAEAAKKAEPTEDDKQALASLAKDFPEVKQALEIQERLLTAKFEQVLDTKLSEIVKQIEPVVATTQTIARNAHEEKILSRHADAITLLPDVDAWIAQQPAFLQEGYNKVLDAGSADQIIEFYDHFKKATGRDQAAADQSEQAAKDAQAAAEKEKAEAERQKKLASQEGVKGRRGENKGGVPEDDFEGGFTAAISK